MSTDEKPKILLLGGIDHTKAKDAWSALSSLGTLLTPKATNPTDFLQECRSGSLDGVKAVYRTFQSVSITGRIEGAGYDQISVSACTSHGIFVSNTPQVVDAATADTAIFLMLGALRGFNLPLLTLRKGEWRGKTSPPLGHDPEGKKLGILGMGGIGRDIGRKAEGFGMSVVYHNRKRLPPEEEGGAKYVSFEELLKGSDVLSLNLPLNVSSSLCYLFFLEDYPRSLVVYVKAERLQKNTRHIISTPQFAQMKDGVVIINTARGPVMDEAALVDALKSGKVFSVGLDVFEEEPKVHPGLLENEHVLLLPHMGTATYETQEKMELHVIDNVRSALEMGKLVTPVPEQQA
ncbi:uncharacterized protein KY384_002068 [Bacidia gigantensis]|uniref:uncharacterized protein n=1 Tax=Bacidia gigantensis TaxID=2732470 RepID=UPI001D03B3C5|nr:uncharacterized protein KY384_002068 [Bacidia gigantensis]KAG8533285.1 hypothetical protein KY384_002068 [Bacidia gigantensis]